MKSIHLTYNIIFKQKKKEKRKKKKEKRKKTI
jgi:hypothetical protein